MQNEIVVIVWWQNGQPNNYPKKTIITNFIESAKTKHHVIRSTKFLQSQDSVTQLHRMCLILHFKRLSTAARLFCSNFFFVLILLNNFCLIRIGIFKKWLFLQTSRSLRWFQVPSIFFSYFIHIWKLNINSQKLSRTRNNNKKHIKKKF